MADGADGALLYLAAGHRAREETAPREVSPSFMPRRLAVHAEINGQMSKRDHREWVVELGWCPETELRDARPGWPGGAANQLRPRLQRAPSAFHLYSRNNTHPPSPFQTDRHRPATFSTNDADTLGSSSCFSCRRILPGRTARRFSLPVSVNCAVRAIATTAIGCSYFHPQGRKAVYEAADQLGVGRAPGCTPSASFLASSIISVLHMQVHSAKINAVRRLGPDAPLRSSPAKQQPAASTAPRMFGTRTQAPWSNAQIASLLPGIRVALSTCFRPKTCSPLFGSSV